VSRTPDEKLRWAFRMYDEDNSRQVDLTEMENVMKVKCSTESNPTPSNCKRSGLLLV
jgi:Ca2+-binding EF-hand superfamily protein